MENQRLRKVILLLSTSLTMLAGGCASSPRTVESRNIDVVRVVFSEVWSKGDIGLVDELYDVNFVGHFPGETFNGREGIRSHVLAHRKSFPDWTEEIQDIFAERNSVAVRFTSRGTNLGDFLGSPATGNRVEISEAAIFKLKDGKIVEQWVYPDMLSLQRQLQRQRA